MMTCLPSRLAGARSFGLLLMFALAWLPGCGQAPPAATDAKGGSAEKSPAKMPAAADASDPLKAKVEAAGSELAMSILKRMADAYKGCTSYADKGRIQQHYTEGTELFDKPIHDFSVAFVRPNKIRLQCYEGVMTCDGKDLAAVVRGIDDQVVVDKAPETLTYPAVHLNGDTIWMQVLTKQIAGGSPQLALLMADDALAGFLAGGEAPVMDRPEKIDGHPCHRVKISRPDGALVLSIDEKTSVLRRIELPMNELKKHLDPEGTKKGLKVTAEFVDAQLNAEIPDSTFAFQTPEGVYRVRHFVDLSPPKLLPTLGKPAAGVTLVGLDSKEFDLATLKGKVVVLDFWGVACPPCVESLPLLNTVYQKYKENDSVRIFAVNIDQADQSNDDLTAFFKKLNIEVPIVRLKRLEDLMEKFGVDGIPMMAILDGEQLIQEIKLGMDDQLAKTLPERIDQVRAGKNLYQEIVAAYKAQLVEYEQTMKDASAELGATEDGVVPPAEKSQPARLKLAKLWTSADLKGAGNITFVPAAGDKPARLLAFDGWRTVAELDLTGKQIARHELPLGEEEAACYLRTAVDGKGKRYYVAYAAGLLRLHLFDENWKLLWHHPEGQHEGLGEVRLADLEGKGELGVYVAYFGKAGVHGLSIAGERMWSNRSLEQAGSLALTPSFKGKPGSLVATNAQGSLVAIDAKGGTTGEFQIGTAPSRPQGRLMRYVAASDLNSDGNPEYLGLAITAAQSDIAVGISSEGQEIWSRRLPAGRQSAPVEAVVAGRLPGMKHQCWVLPGANGAIQFVSADGTLIDEFNYGAHLAGIALIEDGGKQLLLVSNANGEEGQLTAWELSGDLNIPAATPLKAPAIEEGVETSGDKPVEKTAAKPGPEKTTSDTPAPRDEKPEEKPSEEKKPEDRPAEEKPAVEKKDPPEAKKAEEKPKKEPPQKPAEEEGPELKLD